MEDPLQSLGLMEDILQCQICYELLQAPVLLPTCMHFFCSSCIRSNIDHRLSNNQPPICPLCRVELDPSHLRACVTVRDSVLAFKKLKRAVEGLLAAAANKANAPLQPPPAANQAKAPPQPPPVLKKRPRDSDGDEEKAMARTPKEEVMLISSDDDSEDGADAGKVKAGKMDLVKVKTELNHKLTAEPVKVRPGHGICPICQIQIKLDHIQSHALACMERQEGAPGPSSKKATVAATSAAPSFRAKSAAFSRQDSSSSVPLIKKPNKENQISVPPKIIFTLLGDRDLKQRLKELGLSLEGKRQDWEARYQCYRRYIQTKIDEGAKMTMAQLRSSFALQEKQLLAARTIKPKLTRESAEAGGPSALAGLNGAQTHEELAEQARRFAAIRERAMAARDQAKDQQGSAARDQAIDQATMREGRDEERLKDEQEKLPGDKGMMQGKDDTEGQDRALDAAAEGEMNAESEDGDFICE